MADKEQMDFDVETDEEAEANNLRKLNLAILADSRYDSERLLSLRSPETSVVATQKPDNSNLIKDIKSALMYNKLISDGIKRLENVLSKRLVECCEKQNIIKNMEQTKKSESSKVKKKFSYITLGRPYFKDESWFPAPPNKDTILMAQSEMYDMHSQYSVSRWTVRDKKLLFTSIHESSLEIRTTELTSLLHKYQRELKTTKNPDLENKIQEVQKQLKELPKKRFNELALPLNQEHCYDWELITSKMYAKNERHSPNECRALWKMCLHPSINTTTWSKEEHDNLKPIVNRYNGQDWDAIAKDLNTNRTGFNCFVYYRTNDKSTITGVKWNDEEAEYMMRIVDYYRDGNYIPWGKISAQMIKRTKSQVYRKYHRMTTLKKGRFSREEDNALLSCMDKFGNDLKKVADCIDRSVEQVRERYAKLNFKTSVLWTVEEDKKLIKLLANQDEGLKNFFEIVKFFPGKTRVHLRTRYLTLTKFMSNNPGVDLSMAPRRATTRQLRKDPQTEELNKALNKLKRKFGGITSGNTGVLEVCDTVDENTIDNAIIDILKEEENDQTNPETTVEEITNYNGGNIKKLLILLKFQLQKHEFEKSITANMYPDIISGNLKNTKVYTYSKKAALSNEALETPTASIWCEDEGSTIQTRNFLMPPNYSTIIGCKRLMEYTHVHSMNRKSEEIVQKSGNPIFNKHYDLFKQNFEFLFMTAMILSNRQPHERNPKIHTKIKETEPVLEIEKTTQSVVPMSNMSIAIPDINKMRRYRKKKSAQAKHVEDVTFEEPAAKKSELSD